MYKFTRNNPATVIMAVLLLVSLLSIASAAKTWRFDAATIAGNTTVGGTLGVTGATTLTGAVTGNGAWTIGDAVGDTVTVNGTPTFKEAVITEKTISIQGNTTLGNAATDTITCTGAFIPRVVATDPMAATPADRPAGTQWEVARYGSRLYLCTDATVDTEVWIIVGPPA